MTQMSLRWTLAGPGWADCTVADGQAEAEITASYITSAPEELGHQARLHRRKLFGGHAVQPLGPVFGAVEVVE